MEDDSGLRPSIVMYFVRVVLYEYTSSCSIFVQYGGTYEYFVKYLSAVATSMMSVVLVSNVKIEEENSLVYCGVYE